MRHLRPSPVGEEEIEDIELREVVRPLAPQCGVKSLARFHRAGASFYGGANIGQARG
jgi:hypothetical protein